MSSSLKSRWLILLPALVVLLAVAQQLHFLLPAIHDLQTESYEPAKTLRFVATHGHAVHKWGPMPGFFFAPAYAAVLGEAKLTHHLGHLNGVYPFGFDDPVAQIGHLILAGRVVVLAVSLLAILVLTWTLARNLAEPRVALVVLACLSTSIVSLEPLVDTKPDGLMIALLTLALAGYATIVMRGLTVFRAVITSLFYVASVSCKELTSTSMFLPFLGLAVGVFLAWRHDSTEGHLEGRRQLRALIAACVAVPVFYLLFNVIYAPHAWLERMHYVFGPLKDPSVWAAPGQTHLTYLRDTMWAVGEVLGWGGLVVLAISVVGTLLKPSARLLALWLPFLSHLIFTTISAGYMPAYFMLPLAPMLCLPASEVVAVWFKARAARPGYKPWPVVPVAAVVGLLCLYLGLNAMTLFRETHHDTLIARSFDEAVPRGATVNVLGLWTTSKRPDRTAGPNGTEIDHEAAFVLAGEPKAELPQYILVDRDLETWMQEIRNRPARGAMLEGDTGYDYGKFPGVEGLGYDPVATVVPRYSGWVAPRLVMGHNAYTEIAIKVYRTHDSAATGVSRVATGPDQNFP